MLTRIGAMLKSVQIQDIFDIAIIAIMISALLVWFKDRASRFVLGGIGVLGVIYGLARFFQLYLTTWVLQGFFAIFLFVLVVIFQEDLRRLFERLALWGRFKISLRETAASASNAEVLASAAANLARRHIGALIVISGSDPLDRHLTGGVPLDGLLSEPLLESIFDPHSKGHDGAVVIRGNRVEQFGCHLPLTGNIHPRRHFGLRHTAALGLAERSDALCLVVSEERGTLSLAQGEQLREVENAAELKNALEDFFAQRAPARPQHPILVWLKKNPKEKALALALAFILWLSFGYQRDSVQRDFIVPIEYVNLSPGWVLEGSRSTDAVVTLSGPSQAFQILDPARLKVSIDLADTRPGKVEIPLAGSLILPPAGLNVESIKPERITITLSRYEELEVPIEAVTERPPRGWVIQQTLLSPSSLRVLLPDKISPRQVQLKTEPVPLEATAEFQSHRARVLIPAEVRTVNGKSPEVTVTVKLRKKGRGSSPRPRESAPEAADDDAR